MLSNIWATDKTDPAIVEEKKRYEYLLGPLHRNRPEAALNEPPIADLVQPRYDDVVSGNAFYTNLGGGKFAEVSGSANLETFWPWGIAVCDFDNDGFQDAFVSAGMGYHFSTCPNAFPLTNATKPSPVHPNARATDRPPARDFPTRAMSR